MSVQNFENPATESELRLKILQKVMNNSPSMIYVIDLKSFSTVFANGPMRKFLGYTDHELSILYRNPQQSFAHPDEIDYIQNQVHALLEGPPDTPTVLTYRVRHKNGQWKTLRDTMSHFFVERVDHEPNHFLLGIAHDITAQTTLENHLIRFFEMSQDLLAIWDTGARIQRVSPSFLRMVGMSALEFERIDPFSLVHPDDLESARHAQRRLMAGEVVHNLETRMRTKTGDYRTIQWHLVPDVENRLTFVVARDITERKNNELKMIHNSRLTALGEMAGGLAHEINNPLAIIAGRLTLMRDSVLRNEISKERLADQLQKLEATVARITKIIRGLRAFSRSSDEESFTPTPLCRIIEDALDLCQERIKNTGIQLHISSIPDEVVPSRGVQLSQVLLNLLHNAYDAVHGRPDPRIELQVEARESAIRIAVTDNGAGVPHEITDRIMEPFFTTKEIGKGVGLGLSISKGIVEDHGGRLYVDSQSTCTRFVVELPRR